MRHAGRRELAVFAAAYLTYFGVRAITQGREPAALAHADAVIDAERAAGIAWEGAVQSVVKGSAVLTDAANFMYMFGHWPVLIVTGVALFHWRRDQYRVLRDACLISGLVGLAIFALYPVAPPRLTDLPLVDTVTQGAQGYRQIVPPSLVNEYAAMPSFHAGWNLLAGITIFRASRHWAPRTFGVAMPAAMAFAVVATANHYILDVVAGMAIAMAALWAALRIERRRGPTLDHQAGSPHADHERARTSTFPHRPSRRQRPREPSVR